jgi:formyl-CoA transferase
MEKWGLGYDVLSKINPGLIMIRVSGYGQTGPYASRAGYAAIGEAMGGMRYLAGWPDKPPSRAGISIGDSLAATFACTGALAALHHRDKTGQGQVVDSAIYEAVLNVMESTIPEYVVSDYTRERTGSSLPNVAPSNLYKCSDGSFLIAANQDTVFRRLCEAMDRPELADDPRYSTHTPRGDHQQELDDIIEQWTQTKTMDEVDQLMQKHGVPAGRIFRASDMLEDPHFKAREAIVDVPHERWDNLKMQNIFPKLSATPCKINWPGPEELGQHNAEVYGDLLNMSDEEMSALTEKGVL